MMQFYMYINHFRFIIFLCSVMEIIGNIFVKDSLLFRATKGKVAILYQVSRVIHDSCVHMYLYSRIVRSTCAEINMAIIDF